MAEIQIGNHTATTAISKESPKATFELTLEQGDYDLETSFTDNKNRFGALWVYVKKL
jgi:hypothetical protein